MQITYRFLFALFAVSRVALAANDPAVRVYTESAALMGIREIAAKIGQVHGLSELPATKGPGRCIVAGRLTNAHVAGLVRSSKLVVDAEWVGDQGFIIRAIAGPEPATILVVGNTHAGVLYGLMELAERIQEEGAATLDSKLDVRDRPVFQFRLGDPKIRRASPATHWS